MFPPCSILAWRELAGRELPRRGGLPYSRALARDNRNPETLYAAGVVSRAQHKWTKAQDMFWADIRFGGERASAYAQLGEIALVLKDYKHAISLLNQALSYNPADAMSTADLAVALRLAGMKVDAEKALAAALESMPLLPYVRAEQWMIDTARGNTDGASKHAPPDWAKPYPATSEVYLQVAAWYRRLGDFGSSNAVLHDALGQLSAQAISPLVYYYLAANAREQGNDEQADAFARQGQTAPYAKVFPARLADAEVIDDQLNDHPLDAHALFFLGNFLFAHGRYDEAARSWEQAFGQGFEYSVVMRNLGLYAWRVKDDPRDAAQFYEDAIKLAPEDYRLYTDLDEIYFRLGAAGRREKLFAAAPETVRDRDTVLVRRSLLLTQEEKFDQAAALLMDHRFKPWEGGVHVREMYVLANLQKGTRALEEGKPAVAEAALRQAVEYPHNLGAGKPDKPHDEEGWFWLGESLSAQNKTDAARQAWAEAGEESSDGSPLAALYLGLAERRLGKDQASEKTLKPLRQLQAGEKHAAAELYAAGLLEVYEHHNPQASANFMAALNADPEYWQARVMLDRVGR